MQSRRAGSVKTPLVVVRKTNSCKVKKRTAFVLKTEGYTWNIKIGSQSPRTRF
jgi:hypothetical protein